MEKYILTEVEINEIVDYLQGSCESVEAALVAVTDEQVDDLSGVFNEDELHDAIDCAIFLCVQCGWWSEAGDYAEKQDNPSGDICSDCEPEEEE